MNPTQRVVTQTPLTVLWTFAAEIPSERRHDLAADDIRRLLRSGRVHFVVANVGEPLSWVDSSECFRFWKESVQAHLVPPDSRTRGYDFPNGYCYRASLWHSTSFHEPIIVLEMDH